MQVVSSLLPIFHKINLNPAPERGLYSYAEHRHTITSRHRSGSQPRQRHQASGQQGQSQEAAHQIGGGAVADDRLQR